MFECDPIAPRLNVLKFAWQAILTGMSCRKTTRLNSDLAVEACYAFSQQYEEFSYHHIYQKVGSWGYPKCVYILEGVDKNNL